MPCAASCPWYFAWSYSSVTVKASMPKSASIYYWNLIFISLFCQLGALFTRGSWFVRSWSMDIWRMFFSWRYGKKHSLASWRHSWIDVISSNSSNTASAWSCQFYKRRLSGRLRIMYLILSWFLRYWSHILTNSLILSFIWLSDQTYSSK